MNAVFYVMAVVFLGQFLNPTNSEKGQSLKVCTLIACVTEAVIEVQRADKLLADYDLVIEFDGTKERCRLIRDELPEVPNCGDKIRVQLSGTQVGAERISIFATPSKIAITLSDHGKEIATKTFEPQYEAKYPNGKDCGEGCKFWRTVWTLPQNEGLK